MISDNNKGTINNLVENAILGDEAAIVQLGLYVFSKNNEVAYYTASKIKEVEARTGKKIKSEAIGVFLKQFKKSIEEPAVLISHDVERLAYVVVQQEVQFQKSGITKHAPTTEENELTLIRMGGRGKEVDAALERERRKRRG